MTPFKAVYGREAPKLLCYGDIPTANAYVEELLGERDNLLLELRSNMEAAQKRMVNQANNTVEISILLWGIVCIFSFNLIDKNRWLNEGMRNLHRVLWSI